MAEDKKEEPLDPKVEMIRRRMMRLMIISILIMLVGLIAVFGGVVYKINNAVEPEAPETVNATANPARALYSGGHIAVDLPTGAVILDSKLADGALVVDVKLLGGKRQFYVIDLISGKVSTTITFD